MADFRMCKPDLLETAEEAILRTSGNVKDNGDRMSVNHHSTSVTEGHIETKAASCEETMKVEHGCEIRTVKMTRKNENNEEREEMCMYLVMTDLPKIWSDGDYFEESKVKDEGGCPVHGVNTDDGCSEIKAGVSVKTSSHRMKKRCTLTGLYKGMHPIKQHHLPIRHHHHPFRQHHLPKRQHDLPISRHVSVQPQKIGGDADCRKCSKHLDCVSAGYKNTEVHTASKDGSSSRISPLAGECDTKSRLINNVKSFVTSEHADVCETQSKGLSTQETQIHKSKQVLSFCEGSCHIADTDACRELQTCTPVQKNKKIYRRDKCYKCDICDVGFTNTSGLKAHKRIHTGEKPFICDVCGVGFAQGSNLKTHKRIHTAEKPYKCDVCSIAFTDSSNLKTHTRIHTGEKPYKCEICGVGFTDSSGLRTHKRMHTGEKPYICDVCGTGFTNNGSLVKHKRTHTGEKPYKCEVCGVGFAQCSNLKTHKRVHTGEKPYKCDVCGSCFAYEGDVNRHMRIHTGEKPYRCHVCGIAFSQHSHLKRHKQIHGIQESI